MSRALALCLCFAAWAHAADAAFGEQGVVARLSLDAAPKHPALAQAKGPTGSPALCLLRPGHKLTGSDKEFPNGKSPGSISLWFNRPDGVGNKVLFSYGSPIKGKARGLWLTTESKLCFYFWGHPQDLYCEIKGGIAPNQWHHVAAAFDGTTAKLYYDGKPVGQCTPGIDTALRGRYQIGANLVDDDRDFVGLLDDIVVLDRALTADEIRKEHGRGASVVAGFSKDDLRVWHVLRAKAGAAQQAELAASARDLGFEEIVFAVRQCDADGHWYANFGYNVVDAERRKYYHDGGKLCRLNAKTGKVVTLVDDPKGGVRDPQLHYDGTKILFSYRKGGQPYYHLYEVGVDGKNLREITDGPYDDIEPTYLPDGDIIFCSSRCQRWVPCYVTQVAVLHKCDSDGKNIRQLSANVEHENTPWVLPDGRILFQRWEYVDRSQVGYHHLWTMNPDGTGQMVYYGNMHPNTVMIDAKPISGTRSVVASFSPGHGRNEHAGAITIVDPALGPDARSMARTVSRRHFRDPYPISGGRFLVAGETDILLLDRDGRAVRLYDLPAAWRRGRMKVHEPRPVRRRPRERTVSSRVEPASKTGTVFLQDIHVGRNMAGIARGEIKKLLVLEVLPKPVNMFSGMEPLSYGGTFLLERILGTVPVEADGSAHFTLPALRPAFLVALDEKGMAVKRMQSFLTVQPGESVGCVGCHENRVRTPGGSVTLAMGRPASVLEPVPDVPDVIDFPRDIQPILDRHCVACHDVEKTKAGGAMAGGILLCGDRGPMFSQSFYALTISAQFMDGRNLRRSNYPPRAIGSAASPILAKLDGSHYKARATDRERRTVRLWTDSGCVYAGTYAALGTGSIGHYSGGGRPDLAWPSVRKAQAVLKKRCGECHKGKTALPMSPSDNKRLVPWSEGAMNALATGKSQRMNPVFRFNRHLLYNLTRPEKSLLLLAPLAPEVGGRGMTRHTGQGGSTDPIIVFKDTSDPDYQTLLAALQDAKAHLEKIKRFDMPGFQPRAEYIREMQRYGLLAAEPGEVDVYALERRYWRSQWYRP
ncbi:PD40 domain-containing protein [bacterium]|nr:PD40 domain-containing protein [bacterium]